MNKIKQIILNSFIHKQSLKIYKWILQLLANHKGIPKFFVYVGLHSIIFIIFVCMVAGMYIYINQSSVASFNQIVYTFYGDSLRNYRLSHLSFEKDMKRRPDNTFNEGDIKLTYAYVKDSTVVTPKKIVPFKSNKYKDSCDLFSIVRFTTCNSIPNTKMDYRNNEPYKFIINKHYFQKTKWVTNHDRYYHVFSTVNDTTHSFTQQTNAKDHAIEWGSINPFFSFWIGINMDAKTILDKQSYIKIHFNDTKIVNSNNGIENPMIVEKVIPQPTKIDINEIVFEGEQLKDVIKQRGIYVSGVDQIKKDEADRKNIQNTVLLGTFIAILFDIFVQLILKWKKLRREEDERP